MLVLSLNLGRTYTLPLSKKKQAGFEIARCFGSALKDLFAAMCENRKWREAQRLHTLEFIHLMTNSDT